MEDDPSDDDPLWQLRLLRSELVDQRRAIVASRINNALRRAADLVKTQELIEAVDRAIEDEAAMQPIVYDTED